MGVNPHRRVMACRRVGARSLPLADIELRGMAVPRGHPAGVHEPIEWWRCADNRVQQLLSQRPALVRASTCSQADGADLRDGCGVGGGQRSQSLVASLYEVVGRYEVVAVLLRSLR